MQYSTRSITIESTILVTRANILDIPGRVPGIPAGLPSYAIYYAEGKYTMKQAATLPGTV